MSAELLPVIDAALTETLREPSGASKEDALIGLVGVRCSLFPARRRLSRGAGITKEPRRMRYDIDIAGVMIPSLLAWLLIAYVMSALLRPVLQRIGLYRLVWHPALFDLAIYVCLLGGVVYLSSEYLS